MAAASLAATCSLYTTWGYSENRLAFCALSIFFWRFCFAFLVALASDMYMRFSSSSSDVRRFGKYSCTSRHLCHSHQFGRLFINLLPSEMSCASSRWWASILACVSASLNFSKTWLPESFLWLLLILLSKTLNLSEISHSIYSRTSMARTPDGSFTMDESNTSLSPQGFPLNTIYG